MAKKFLSVFLVLALIFSAVSFSFSSVAFDGYPCTDIPTIYITGQGQKISIKENGVEREVYPVKIPDGYIENAVKENLGVFMQAVITQKWDKFGDVLQDIMSDIFGELKLDEYGNPINASYGTSTRIDNLNIDGSTYYGKYPLRRFDFCYDWRMDPCRIADDLQSYIKMVMKITGCDRVALCGRCLGSCIIGAYLEKYGNRYISDAVFYASALNGTTVLSRMFAGKAYLDPDAVERFAYDMNLTGDEIKNQLIKSFVTVANDTYGLDLLCDAYDNVIDDIYLDIFPKVLIDTLGTWPGFWCMVSDEDYEQAKETVFYGADTQKYAPFIKIIDNYHYSVMVKSAEIIEDCMKSGTEIANITKFGYQTLPITKDTKIISDGYCAVTDSSMGATTTEIDSTFSDKYMSLARKVGNDKYISPDRKIDASTCLVPDRTWFIGNLEHKDFPEIVHMLIEEIINVDGLTVFNGKYPQYLEYINGELVPMTSENMVINQEKYNRTFWDALKTLFGSLFKLIFKPANKNEI